MTDMVEGEDGDGYALHQDAGAERLVHQVGGQAGQDAATQVGSPVQVCRYGWLVIRV